MTEKMELICGILALAAIAGIMLLVALRNERKKNSQPIYEVRATVQSFRKYNFTTSGGKWGKSTVQSWYATFELENGEAIELSCPENIVTTPAGTTGTLMFQGEKCEKFTPDE